MTAPSAGRVTNAGGAADIVRITGVRALGRHGVLPDEHREPQPFIADIAMTIDTVPAALTDDLRRTVSYAEVAADAIAIIRGEHVDLIETLAGRIADAVLARDLVEQVEVSVHKPEAPVGVPYSDVIVTVTRADVRPAVVALGANEGDSLAALRSAVAELADLPRTRLRAVSDLVETDPVGGPEQPDYLNAVALLDTTLRPHTLLRYLHEIEARHGRTRETRWGQRTLDLDLVQYGDPRDGSDVVSDGSPVDVTAGATPLPSPTLPHPRAHERGFVLVPWAQVDHSAHLRVGREVVAVTDAIDSLPQAADGADGADRADGAVQGVRPGPDWGFTPPRGARGR